MSRRAKKRASPSTETSHPFADILAELRLDPAHWDIELRLTKGVLSGQRGAVVVVKDLRSGRSAKASRAASTKNAVRAAADDLVRELLVQLSK